MSSRGCAILVEGWVKKKGNVRRNWKRRWMILREDSIEYYEKNSEKVRNILKGSIPIDQVISISRFEGKKKMKYCMALKTVNRVYYISVATAEEQERWLTVVSQHLRQQQPANLYPSPSGGSLEILPNSDKDGGIPNPEKEEFHDISLS